MDFTKILIVRSRNYFRSDLETLPRRTREANPVGENSSFMFTFCEILPRRTCEANPVGENSSFMFTVCVKSVPLYHFKLTHVVPHMAVKEVLETSKNGEISHFNLESHF